MTAFLSRSQAFAGRPQNFMRHSQNFMRGPQNFMRRPQNFMRHSQNFMRHSQNFMRGPQNFMRRSQNFMRRSQGFMRGSQDFLRGSQNFMRRSAKGLALSGFDTYMRFGSTKKGYGLFRSLQASKSVLRQGFCPLPTESYRASKLSPPRTISSAISTDTRATSGSKTSLERSAVATC